jgi:hypothetical protein
VLDAADSIGVSVRVLVRVENGESVGNERLFEVLWFWPPMLAIPKGKADVALEALGHTANWNECRDERVVRWNIRHAA